MLADSDVFGDACISDPAKHVLGRVARTSSPAWAQLRDVTDALALLQASDGSLTGDAAAAERHVDVMIDAIARQASRFPHQAKYLRAVLEDLRAWADGDFARPDFTRSLDAFRPERHRRDGVESLVVFPMYKQNGSRDTCFEALLIRTSRTSRTRVRTSTSCSTTSSRCRSSTAA